MRVSLIIIISSICLSMSAFGQRKGVAYKGISSDSTIDSHLLVFLTDSTVEISSIPRHMSGQFKKLLSYKKVGSLILVLGDPKAGPPTRMPNVAKGFNVLVDGRALLDTIAKTVYVPQDEFKNSDLLYVIDGKRYKQRIGTANGYGIINGKVDRNTALVKRLRKLGPTADGYDIRVLKGLAAYWRYGYRYVFGVIEISLKQ